MVRFAGKVLFVGCGSIAQVVIPLFLKHVDIHPSKITVIDFTDNRDRIKESLDKGVTYVQKKIDKDNYKHIFDTYLQSGDFLIDLAWNLDTCCLLDYCHQRGILFMNTSVERWDPYDKNMYKSPATLTLYDRQMAIQQLVDGWENKKGPTLLVDHGANPGLVSQFTKQALTEIAAKVLVEKPNDPRRKKLEDSLDARDFSRIAQLIGLKVIHISERDTQIIDSPKQVNEFVNTWSVDGFIEEGLAPAELGWGTHENSVPKGAYVHTHGPKNQICLSSRGMNTWVRSWVPSGEIKGMLIRHGEAYSLSHYLTVHDHDGTVYRPTVHYAYCPCDGAINSMHELEMRRFAPQERKRILNNEIVSGYDELGCLLMGHDFKAWWIGSILGIEESRKLLPGQSATTLQVAVGVLGACLWMIQNPNKGFCQPENLDHEAVLNVAKPYLGEFISTPVDWTPLQKDSSFSFSSGSPAPKSEDEWQFSTFLVSHKDYIFT